MFVNISFIKSLCRMNGIKNKKILLIGGTGFIGLNLAKRLSSLDWEVTLMSRGISKIKKLDFSRKIKLIKGDVRDYKIVEENIKNKDVIINLAAVVNPASDFNPYQDLDVNCKGQLNILEARKNVNPNSKYIFFGTRAQFGKTRLSDSPLTESFCQRPISLYGIHKQASENYCYLYSTVFNLESIILRLSIVYGHEIAGENMHNIIDKFIKKALKNEKFYVNGHGKDLKDLIYIEDLIDLLVKIIESDVMEGTFNVGSGKKIKLIDIARKIVKLCGSGSFEARPFPKGIKPFELGSFYFDISKVKKAFNWKPKTDIDAGLKKVIESYK